MALAHINPALQLTGPMSADISSFGHVCAATGTTETPLLSRDGNETQVAVRKKQPPPKKG